MSGRTWPAATAAGSLTSVRRSARQAITSVRPLGAQDRTYRADDELWACAGGPVATRARVPATATAPTRGVLRIPSSEGVREWNASSIHDYFRQGNNERPQSDRLWPFV